MKLQAKIMVIMASAWLVICSIVIADSKFIITQNYKNIEKEIIQHRIQDTQRALERMLDSLSLYTLAWSQWDDAYAFMKTKSTAFIQSNFVPAIYRTAHLNFIIFYNSDGKLYYGRAYDTAKNTIASVPPLLLEYISKNKFFVTYHDVTSHQVGLFQTKMGLIVMSSRPVLMSNGKKPSRGSLLMGYYLDDTFFNTLSKTVGMEVKFLSLSQITHDNQLRGVYEKLLSTKQYAVLIVGPKIEHGFILLRDIDASPVGLIRVEIPRLLYRSGLMTIYHYISVVLLSGILVILLTLYLLKVFVLDRVFSISNQIARINREREFDQQIAVSGHDELSKMVFTINNMLDLISNSQSQLRYMASHDPLTHLPNRDYFYELSTQAILRANETKSKVAVMFMDIDKLKKVNDSYGHAVGDKLIKIAAKRIKNSLRESDVVARQSGDEFIILMQDITDNTVISLTAQRILQEIAIPFVIDNQTIYVSCSIGISIYPDDGAQIEELIKNADDAMYSTKTKSGNSYNYYNHELLLCCQGQVIASFSQSSFYSNFFNGNTTGIFKNK